MQIVARVQLFLTQYTIYGNQTCSLGFNPSESEKYVSACDQDLHNIATSKHNCTISNGVANKTCDSGQQFWVGYDD